MPTYTGHLLTYFVGSLSFIGVLTVYRLTNSSNIRLLWHYCIMFVLGTGKESWGKLRHDIITWYPSEYRSGIFSSFFCFNFGARWSVCCPL